MKLYTKAGISALALVMSWHSQGKLNQFTPQDIPEQLQQIKTEQTTRNYQPVFMASDNKTNRTHTSESVPKRYIPTRAEHPNLPIHKIAEPQVETPTIPVINTYISNIRKTIGAFQFPTIGHWSQGYHAVTHPGIDISNELGMPVKASSNGTIVLAEYNSAYGYGNWIAIHHKEGIETRYAHMDELFVKVGQSVAMGEIIGTVGNTGNSNEPHLHFEIWDGNKTIHPDLFIYQNQ